LEYEELHERIKKRKLIILDGGTGSEIYARKVRGRHYLPWAVNGLLYAPGIVRQVHQDYFDRGSNVVIANSFYTTEYALAIAGKFSKADFSGTADSLTRLAVYLAIDSRKQARKKGKQQTMCIAGSVGPLEVDDPYDRRKTPHTTTIQMENEERINGIVEAGADFVLVETMTTLREAHANIELINDMELDVPFWISFSCNSDGILYGGEPIEDVVKLLEKYPSKPDVLSINCTKLEGVSKALEALKETGTSIPIAVYANVEERIYPKSTFFERPRSITPKKYADCCFAWHNDFGVNILGGCCGTTPRDIEVVVERFKDET